MKNEFRWRLARIGGFAGLTIGAALEHVGAWWKGLQAPYLMPHAWHALLALAFGVGGVIGCAIAAYTLAVRGLL